MPEIPRFKAKEPVPTLAGVAPAISLTRQAQRLFVHGVYEAEQGIKNVIQIRQADEEATRKAKAIELGNSINDDVDKLADSLNERDPKDYDKFEDDMGIALTNLRAKYDQQIGNDQRLGMAINAHFGQQANMLMKVTRDKKFLARQDVSTAEFMRSYNQAIKDYADATDPTAQEMVENKISIEGLSLVSSGLMKQHVFQGAMEKFKDNADKMAVDQADVQVDQDMMKNAAQTFVNLADPNYLPKLTGKLRQDKSEKAWRASKVQEADEKRQEKEALDLARDNEEVEMARIYGAKKYSELYSRAQNNKILTGQRMQHWMDAAENATTKEEKIDPIVEAQEYAFINNLIAKGVTPNVIRDSIIITPRLREPTKAKLLDRVDKQIDKEINRAASRAHEYMKREIVSPTGIAGVLARAIPENERAANYARAQNALDDWIDKQMITEKPITATDVQMKAEELVKSFRPKFQGNSPLIQKKNQDMIQGLKELGEISKGQQKIAPITQPTKAKVYKNVEEVKAAYDRKELTWDQAREILQRDFGIK